MPDRLLRCTKLPVIFYPTKILLRGSKNGKGNRLEGLQPGVRVGWRLPDGGEEAESGTEAPDRRK